VPLNPNRTPEWVRASDPYDVHEPTGELLAEIPRTFEVFIAARDLQLPPTAKLVLLMLVSRASPQHRWRCWPSHAAIAKDAGLGRTAVKDALCHLQAKGLVSWVSRKAEQRPNLYQVCVWRWM